MGFDYARQAQRFIRSEQNNFRQPDTKTVLLDPTNNLVSNEANRPAPFNRTLGIQPANNLPKQLQARLTNSRPFNVFSNVDSEAAGGSNEQPRWQPTAPVPSDGKFIGPINNPAPDSTLTNLKKFATPKGAAAALGEAAPLIGIIQAIHEEIVKGANQIRTDSPSARHRYAN